MENGRLLNEQRISKATETKLKLMPDYVSAWYLNMKASKKTAATCRDFVNKIYNFLKSIDENVKEVKPSDITETNTAEFFLSTQTKMVDGEQVYTSDSYQQAIWSCLNSFLGFMYRRKEIPQNYIQLITRPKNNDLERINENRVRMTEDDFKKTLVSAEKKKNQVESKRDVAILMVFMNTGMRKTALSTIMLGDLNLEERTLDVIDKRNKRHQYYLNDVTVKALEDWLSVRSTYAKRGNDDHHLFLSNRGRVMSGNTIYQTVERYTEAGLGKGLSPHKLRAGYCTILYDKTEDLEFTRRAVGHSQASTTARYIVTKGDEKERAAGIMEKLIE